MSHTIPHWLTKQADLSPEKLAIKVHQGESLTFLQLKEKSMSFAKKLAQFDINERSKVAIFSTNCLEMVITIHAVSYLNAVAVLLNTRLTKNELNYQLKEAKVDIVIVKEKQPEFEELMVNDIVSFNDIEQSPECTNTRLANEINLSDPFTMMFTSGTTGYPKGVIHTYKNHWWSAIGSALNLGLHKNDKWLATLPLFHVGGLSILLRSVIYGMSVYLFEQYHREEVHRALMEENITIASLVTLMLRDLIDLLKEKKYPDTLRCLLLGGGSIPETTLQQVKEKQLPVFQSYGMTETSSQIVTLSAKHALTKLGSAGKPLLPAQLKIECSDEESIGEILVKGPMVINGYANREAENKDSFLDGWFKTGDLGYLDEEGFLYVVDRRSDLIISGGENIYPTEIENKLLMIDGIIEAAVVGMVDERWGETPIAFIVTDNHDIDVNGIKKELSSTLASYKLPKQIHQIHTLPKTASNKVRRHKLVELLTNDKTFKN